jgi:DHA2 family multidrug resistance protein
MMCVRNPGVPAGLRSRARRVNGRRQTRPPRSLAAGSFYTFVHGCGLNSSQFVFPVFIQQLLGFSPLQSGMIMLPSSLTAAVLMPITGRAVRGGFPPQPVAVAGLISFFAFTSLLSQSTLASGQADFFWPLILRGFGLSLMFAPITTIALAGLSPKDVHQAVGLMSMLRQLGASLGVALTATFIQHRVLAHRQDLLVHVTPFDFPLRERMQIMMHGLMAIGTSFVTAQRAAYAANDGAVSRQALLLTYMDAFRIIGVFFLICMPLLAVLRRRPSPGPVPSIH